MLPFDKRPWAKSVARAVIVLSVVAAIAGGYYVYTLGELHVPEVAIIVLSLLAIIPPNVAIVMRKQAGHTPTTSATAATAISPTLHPR
jgi:hypothetical protein